MEALQRDPQLSCHLGINHGMMSSSQFIVMKGNNFDVELGLNSPKIDAIICATSRLLENMRHETDRLPDRQNCLFVQVHRSRGKSGWQPNLVQPNTKTLE